MLDYNKNFDAVVSEYLRTDTFPVAVKVVRKGQEVPAVKAKQPMKNLKHQIACCQAVSMARKLGNTVLMEKDDHACPLAIVMLGYVTEPDFLYTEEGNVVKPLYTGTFEAAKKTQEMVPQPAWTDTQCVIVAPLNKADFDPDGIIIYGNPAQMTRCIQGALWNEGGAVTSNFAGRGACGGYITTSAINGKYNLVCPGGGEKVFALTQDYELAFAIPAAKFDSFLEGLVATHKGGVARIPTPVAAVSAQPGMPPKYGALSEYCAAQK